MIDTLAFAIFLLLAEKFGSECLTATSLAFTINGMIFIPMIGMAQATSILVGQRLGENLPDDAERIIWKGLACSLLYMSVFALLFILAPNVVILLFESEGNPEQWVLVANHLRIVLVFIAIYSLFDSIAVVLAFGLKGAGDTFFVTRVSLILSWPIMVIPSYLAGRYDWSFYWTWGFASAYIAAQGICFYYRFRVGKWKSMRVIENAEFGIRSAE